jgi:hypothetical protein
MVIFVALVITGSVGGKYGAGIVLAMKYISVILGQVVVQKLHRVVALGLGDLIAALVSFKERGQRGVLMRILVGPTNVVGLVRMQVVDYVMQELRR